MLLLFFSLALVYVPSSCRSEAPNGKPKIIRRRSRAPKPIPETEVGGPTWHNAKKRPSLKSNQVVKVDIPNN
jgi:hypothetical protein